MDEFTADNYRQIIETHGLETFRAQWAAASDPVVAAWLAENYGVETTEAQTDVETADVHKRRR